MLSLTGVPPSGGFTAKFAVFGSVVRAEMAWLAIIGVITSVVSGYYYLRVVYYSFMFESEEKMLLRPATGVAIAIAITVVVTFVLGVYPNLIFNAAQQAVFPSA